jgi:phosphopantothenoylcysteine synthetase/decarboxylase
MRVIVTCGPSYEPIDQVRRLTNFSTGELGLMLSAELARAGHDVLCLKGDGAVSRTDAAGAEVITFSTNDDLLRKLEAVAEPGDVAAVFHAAALCDYRIAAALGADGAQLRQAKLPTRAGAVTLTLEPATKLLPRLRAIFPKARIAGWKYELDGDRLAAVSAGERQIAECGTAACVVNGRAWGEGFGFLERGREPVPLADKPSLCLFLRKWLE